MLTSEPIKIHEDRSISNTEPNAFAYRDLVSCLSKTYLLPPDAPGTVEIVFCCFCCCFGFFLVTINSETAKLEKEMAFRFKSLRSGVIAQWLCDGQPSFIYPPHL